MREIKFRAWDKDTKQFEYFGLYDSHKVFVGHNLGSEYVLMQYTGFQTNGEEIYEGDIIENDSEWWTVYWSECEGRWECKPENGGNVYLGLCELAPSQETWVKGNIYQNPELTK